MSHARGEYMWEKYVYLSRKTETQLMTVGDKLEKRQTKPCSRQALCTVAIYRYMYVKVHVRTVYDSAVRTRTITCMVDNKSRAKEHTAQHNHTRATRLRKRAYTWEMFCLQVYSSCPSSLLSICSLAVGYSLFSPIL